MYQVADLGNYNLIMDITANADPVSSSFRISNLQSTGPRAYDNGTGLSSSNDNALLNLSGGRATLESCYQTSNA